MKIALVHELLTMRGGAERMLRVLADMFPEAPIYTLLYDEKRLGDWFPRERVRTSAIQKLAYHPLLQTTNYKLQTRLFNHHLYLPWFPKAVEAWDFSQFDLVLSTSSAFVHGIITNGKPKHLSYIQSPARYLWDRTHEVLKQTNPLLRPFAARLFHRLRIWDSEAADRADTLIAASREVQRRIELYWRRESEVIYPPIGEEWFDNTPAAGGHDPQLRGTQDSPYCLLVSTLARYKRIDLAIEACNVLKVPLKIAGEGPDRPRLQKLAGSTVTFLGYQSHDELKQLYANATATIFPGEEDFGLVPLESMACGTPVIAYRAGGALETIVEGKTGMFFDEPTSVSLEKALKQFDPGAFRADDCLIQAQEFSRERFERSIRNAISRLK